MYVSEESFVQVITPVQEVRLHNILLKRPKKGGEGGR